LCGEIGAAERLRLSGSASAEDLSSSPTTISALSHCEHAAKDDRGFL
jgi:hypothetical protein